MITSMILANLNLKEFTFWDTLWNFKIIYFKRCDVAEKFVG